MNPFRTIKDAYAALSIRISTKVDRLENENRERLVRRSQYEADIDRGREQVEQRRNRE